MVHVALGQATVVLFALAGLILVPGTGGGPHLTVPAVILSLGAAIYNARVLLVEIIR
ncbi:MAG TPA: hypothetical protein VKY90_03580 [Candidatus Dormibacteraeota bacterium]|nr:hypothetical protein [Candidatus Dormibacteraeota bacterium]